MVAPAARHPETMRRVNEHITDSLVHGGRDEPVAFFCECDDPDCYRAVWLAPVVFQSARSDPSWVALAEGHVAFDASVRYEALASDGVGA